MIDIQVTLPKPSALSLTPSVAEFQREIDRVVIPALQREVTQRLAPPPGPVRYPFQFATARSRRAYFATNGFGKGIPYRRTGDLGRAWKVDHLKRNNGGVITVYNAAPYAGYVYGAPIIDGFNQVPGHARTGWGKGFGADLATLAAQGQALLQETWEGA